MFDKRFSFSSLSNTGEPLVIPVTADFSKTANTLLPDLVEYIQSLPEADPNMVRTVITALSAFEAFGPNRNGDAWLEEHLLRPAEYQHNGENVTIPMYRSFELFSRPYRHHINKPDSPAYGNVMKAFYNPEMRRVELVVEWDRSKAPDIVESLEQYKPVETSIGFRCMPVDTCSICGNPAKSRREYCSHLKHQMLQVMPDGRVVCAINPQGMFFDISAVDDAADRTSRAVSVSQIFDSPQEEPVKVAYVSSRDFSGWMSKQFAAIGDMGLKIAQLCEGPTCSSTKKASEEKVSDIIKRVQAQVELTPEQVERMRVAMERYSGPAMSKKALRALAQYPIKIAAATCAALGIDLYPQEFQYIGIYKEFPKVAESLWDKNIVISSIPTPWVMDEVDLDLAEKMASVDPLMEARSMWIPWKMQQLSKHAFANVNPYVAPSLADGEQMVDITPEKGMSAAKQLVLIASLFAGARLLAEAGGVARLPGTVGEQTLALLGLAGLTGYFTGRENGAEIVRMPIIEDRIERLSNNPGPADVSQAMSVPLAYNMLFGKTAGVLTSAMQANTVTMEKAAQRLNAMRPFLGKETSDKLGALGKDEWVDLYDLPLLDALMVNNQ